MKLTYGKLAFAVLIVLVLASCQKERQKDASNFIRTNLNESVKITKLAIQAAYNANRIPRGVKDNGDIFFCGDDIDWTKGFFPGLCWELYAYSNQLEFKTAAEFFQAKFEKDMLDSLNFDLGFIFNNSYGKGFGLTGNQEFKKVLISASETLIKRYNPNVGCIQAWDLSSGWPARKGWKFPVVVNTLMDLELLFEATILTGDKKYANVAVNHANTTLKNQFRDNFGSYHVVDYNPENGQVRNKETVQGFSHESTWARGHAMAVYGFTMCYRYTNDERYLKAAEKAANFVLSHPNLPEDKILYWDFDAPKSPNQFRDVSSAAILASALVELDGYSKTDFLALAQEIVESLSLQKYKAKGKNRIFKLGHSVGSIPHGGEIDVPVVYADYYYVEALLRLLKIEHGNYKNSGIEVGK